MAGIDAGYQTAYAVLKDGTVRAWGANSHGQLGDGTAVGSAVPVQVKRLAGIAAVTPAGSTTYARSTDGKVWS